MTDNLTPIRCGCGGEARSGKIYGDAWTVECTECGIQSGCFDTKAEAVEAWNRAMGAHDTERTAKAEMVDTGKGTVVFLWKCSECGQFMHRTSWSRPVRYCNYCGAKLDWSGNE